jgi:hypothetical protein
VLNSLGMSVVSCPDCSNVNPADAERCLACGYMLNFDAAARVEPVFVKPTDALNQPLKLLQPRSLVLLLAVATLIVATYLALDYDSSGSTKWILDAGKDYYKTGEKKKGKSRSTGGRAVIYGPNGQSVTEHATGSSGGVGVTLANFMSLSNGMSYSQVCGILGSGGELLSEVHAEGYHIQIYCWYGRGDLGANMNATFENGRLTGKAQFGLR